MILFLDFDGTTHPFDGKEENLFSCLPRIERVLRAFPHVQVVISSWWRVDGLQSMRQYFSEDIRERVISLTPILEGGGMYSSANDLIPRHQEILAWIAEHNYQGQWVALDDDWMGFPDFFPQLIRCDSNIGVDEEIEQKLRLYFSG